jgi:hypothetical protein
MPEKPAPTTTASKFCVAPAISSSFGRFGTTDAIVPRSFWDESNAVTGQTQAAFQPECNGCNRKADHERREDKTIITENHA